MSKRVVMSTGLAIYQALTGTRRDALTDLRLVFYTGAIPVDADDQVDYANQALCTVVGPVGDEGLQWEPATTSGELTKLATQAWEGAVIKTAQPSFARFEAVGDTHAASTADIRLQANVGQGDGDLFVTDLNFTVGQVIPIRACVIAFNRIVSG